MQRKKKKAESLRTKEGRSGNSIDSKRHWRHRLNMEELAHLLPQLRHWNRASPTLRHWHLLNKRVDMQSTLMSSKCRHAKSLMRSLHAMMQRQLHHVHGNWPLNLLRRRLGSGKGSRSKSSNHESQLCVFSSSEWKFWMKMHEITIEDLHGIQLICYHTIVQWVENK